MAPLKNTTDNPVPLRQIAEICGISRTTISRALRGDPRVAKATLTSVRKAARELGYRPNPQLEKLMTEIKQSQRHRFVGNIGVLWDLATISFHKDEKEFNKLMIHGAHDRAIELGYSIDPINMKERGMTPARLDRIIYSRGILGILIPPLGMRDPIPEINWSKVAVISLTRLSETQRFHSVQAHTSRDVIRLFEMIAGRGYRRPGLVIHPDLERRRNKHTVARYLDFCQNVFHIEPLPALKPLRDEDFKDWIQANQPDVVVGPADWCYDALTDHLGLNVPGDIGYAGYIDDPMRGISGILQRPYEIGAAGVDLLTAHILRSETGVPPYTKNVHIESLIIPGKTLRPAP
ncbi:MAG: LacI family DNA-binding transcriptional regulator [Oceanipulchritudo sp.]